MAHPKLVDCAAHVHTAGGLPSACSIKVGGLRGVHLHKVGESHTRLVGHMVCSKYVVHARLVDERSMCARLVEQTACSTCKVTGLHRWHVQGWWVVQHVPVWWVVTTGCNDGA